MNILPNISLSVPQNKENVTSLDYGWKSKDNIVNQFFDCGREQQLGSWKLKIPFW